MSYPEASLILADFCEMKRAEAGEKIVDPDDHPTIDEVYDLMALHPDT